MSPRFKISDLVGNKKVEEPIENNISTKKGRRGKNNDRLVNFEASAFKASNNITIHGNKVKKAKNSTDTCTDILWLHQSKMNDFAKLYDEILPMKEDELEKLNNSNDNSLSSLSSSFTDSSFEKKRSTLEKEIRLIKKREDEMEYLMSTQYVLAEYMNMLDKDDELKMEKDRDTFGSITKFINKYDNIEKERLTEQYCRIMNNGFMISSKKLKFDNSACEHCGAPTKTSEGFTCCVDCGMVSSHSVHDFRLSYHDFSETTMKTIFSYKRINRFREILASLQAKENTEIPDFVMVAVHKEIEKEINIDINIIDTIKIKTYLKRLSLTSYYEHAPHILNKVNGIPPISIPIEVENKFIEMFEQIQDPFEIVKKVVCPQKLSFLSYNFVFYKFCELLSLEEFQKCFTLLKSVDKLRLQDKIWDGICDMLGWYYYPSI